MSRRRRRRGRGTPLGCIIKLFFWGYILLIAVAPLEWRLPMTYVGAGLFVVLVVVGSVITFFIALNQGR